MKSLNKVETIDKAIKIEKIKEILTMNIKSKKYPKKRSRKYNIVVEINDGMIISSQKYIRKCDPDMSDIAIGFYEIIYKEVLSKDILNNKGYLNDKNFAGDTMNSYNTIKNKFYSQNQDSKMLPSFLEDYSNSYHCLANFWLVPMKIGRTLGSLSKASTSKDYMDRFLINQNKKYLSYKEKYNGYYKNFKNIGDFYNLHLLENSYIDSNQNVKKFSNQSDVDKIVNDIIHNIELRAELIAYNYTDELWDYFTKLELI